MKLPKIFCLTLKDTPERKKYAGEHFIKNGLDVEFFEGINGEKFGLSTTIVNKEEFPGEDYFIKSGRIGCLLSHYMLWKTLWHSPYDEILIFEDDVQLNSNFISEFKKFKKQLPVDWGYVFVGHCCLPPKEYQVNISKNIITTTYPPMCTHAYMIKKSSIPTLIDTNSEAWSAVDIQIQKRSLKILSHYVFIPPLVNQISLLKQTNSQDISIDPDNIFQSLTLDPRYK